MEVGEKIRKARKAAGLTRNRLGERVHLSGTAITQYETGKTDVSLVRIKEIARALDMKPVDLLPDWFMEEGCS